MIKNKNVQPVAIVLNIKTQEIKSVLHVMQIVIHVQEVLPLIVIPVHQKAQLI